MEAAGQRAHLVNTGWNGTGKRISIKDTSRHHRRHPDGSIEQAPTAALPIFNLEVPTELHGRTGILDPRDTYADPTQWDAKPWTWPSALNIKNFERFTDNDENQNAW